jgi:hypothetical protein
MTTPFRTPRTTTRADAVRATCANLGIAIVELPGGAFHLHGAGVDLKVTSLRFVELRDLKQDNSNEERRRTYGR